MNPERRKQIEDLCLAALDRADAQQASFLDGACAGDEALRHEIESLLKYQERARSFIEAPALEFAAKTAAADQTRALIGQQINQYRILSLLGAGGMGKVYLAEDSTLRRRVALKLLPAEFTKDPDRVQRFKQEARAISALNHPNIITVFEIGETAGTHYIATEFVDGQTLRQRILSETMQLGDVVDIAVQVAGALEVAHESGIVHRDIKPENIMVRKDGLVKVLDFGVAKLTESEAAVVDSWDETKDPAHTQDGALIGTVRYMSPEQARRTAIDSRSDIFSLGVVLYEMLAGKSPFEGTTATGLITAVLGEEPPPAISCRPEAPEALERILRRALRKEIAERYQTAQEMLADLKELNQAAGTNAGPSSGKVWLVMAAAGLAIATALGIVTFHGRSDDRQPLQAIPLTSYQGLEQNPTLSPDGNYVAFTWNGDAQNNFDIYIRPVRAGGSLQRLTTAPNEDTSPAWSPNGLNIAFLRRLDSHRSQLVVIPAFGGPEHVVTETYTWTVAGNIASMIRHNLAWTPTGEWIAVPDRSRDEQKFGFLLVSVLTGQKRELTSSPTGYFDESPAFSPDGGALVFARGPGPTGKDLYLQLLSSDFTPLGKPKPLTNGGQAGEPAWIGNDRIVYVDGHLTGRLQMITTSGSVLSESIARLQHDHIKDFSVGRDIVFSRSVSDTNIWRAEIPASGKPAVSPKLLISSTLNDNSARYSPDGRKIVFRSGRSGAPEFWIANADGTNAVQRTSSASANLVFCPSWSPNSYHIVFHGRLSDKAGADIFTMPAAGGPMERLTYDFDNICPSYSQDGQWIYFASTRSGQYDIWKMPAHGGQPTRLTFTGGSMPLESKDGKQVFYARLQDEVGIWKIPAGGGESVRITDSIAKDPAFALTDNGIYYVTPPDSSNHQEIRFLNFATKQSRPVVVTERQIGMGLSVSPDGRYLIFAQRDLTGGDLILVRDVKLR